ncbi:MAG: 3'-5' exonuclease [Candidatus Omnitrophica bacterium]|nr:3'-5' exonuclease [Candidatus Omnitrophota bacterium]
MKLTKPLVILDLETTGVWIEKDKIIEIAMIKSFPDGTRTTYATYVNPGMPIPPEVTDVTGIKDEQVKDAPKFRDIANDVVRFLEDADLGGFSVERFDLPLLERELTECGIKFEWSKRTIYDAQKVYHLHERRDLSAAYHFYCGKELIDAHSALADTQATLDVLIAQVKKYGSGNDAIEALKEFDYRKRTEFHDSDRKLRWWNGELYMMFGKYARKMSLQEITKVDRPYLEWILKQDFREDVKDVVEQALEGHFPQPPQAPPNTEA